MTDKRFPILAITFDLDDTLWDISATMLRAEQALHDWLQQHYPRIVELYQPEQLRGLRHEILRQRPDLSHDFTQLRKEGLKLAGQRSGYRTFDHEAAFDVLYQARNDVMFFQDSVPALERLARRYTLAALSNGNADIHRVGLGHVMQFAINAIDVGRLKPDPAMFEAACERLGMQPEQIVHVGDDPHSDVLGAAQMGWKTVWINRTNKVWEAEHQADAEVQSLDDLEMLLDEWERDIVDEF
jgi:putative hydrolase of the HAD superfamily